MLRVYYKYNAASFKEVEWVKLKDKVLHVLPPVQGGGIGHQEKVPNGLHDMHRRTFLEGHRPLPQWAPRFYGLDKAGELLPQIGGSTRPPSISVPTWLGSRCLGGLR